ncbi:hypothetical protein BU24DRAFT_422713 [Aaosphaeria arxii CBS 175.79]|uniref:Uncharacterized protein n=1 Tax=Aaosphaeria arxii CBS 175.79 TaxID=1450172 RepID=A0A6A5XUQ3_9PLEO|nr:uncharacterized protein BU24DRAFT_422713 [Aaosphaeria arxii CBS 175.79]KAF2016360.1 hypothetical protein BU24DRAFT_422713 [Aaosphaeria arxii CBS 175.79]
MHFPSFSITAIFLAGMAVAAPLIESRHKGMVDTPDHRDVGVVFTGKGYTGRSTLLMESKREEPACISLEPVSRGGVQVSSVQVCKAVTCALYEGAGCTGFAVKFEGHQNVTDVESRIPDGRNGKTHGRFLSYACGEAVEKIPAKEFSVTFVDGECE